MYKSGDNKNVEDKFTTLDKKHIVVAYFRSDLFYTFEKDFSLKNFKAL